MTQFDVPSDRGHTAVHIGDGALARLPALVGTRRAVLLIDREVERLHGECIRAALAAPWLGVVRLPRGEAAKRWSTARRVFDELARLAVRRDDILVAAGGGATLDAAGFAASTWMRGTPWISIPTTLVGQSDACLGGKTALDLAAGKNLVGTFHPPLAAVVEPRLARTVPRRDHLAARFELLKCGWVGDPELTRLVSGGGVESAQAAHYTAAVERALRLKARLIEDDLEDRAGRRLLNLGHTFGHALEAAESYRGLRHGEAVGVGLLAACAAAERYGLLSEAGLSRKCNQVLALSPPEVSLELAAAASQIARLDKKASGADPNRLVLILPKARSAVIRGGVEATDFRNALRRASVWTIRGFDGRRRA